MTDVFLSYAREDQARAEQIATALTAAGYDVFWDATIPPGKTWADVVEAKLLAAKAVVVLWSAASTASRWVREEARLARDRGNLIPVQIETVAAPFGFGEIQMADLHAWNGSRDNPQWRLLLDAIAGTVGRPTAAAAASTSAGSAGTLPLGGVPLKKPAKRIQRQTVLIVGGILLVLFVAAVVVIAITARRPSTASATESEPVAETSELPSGTNYANELTDFGVPPQSGLQENISSETPTHIPGAQVVTTQEVARWWRAREVLLIDVLPEGSSRPGAPPHASIPGALRIPGAGDYGDFRDEIQRNLGSRLAAATGLDLKRPIVFFCQGARCWESYNAALRARVMGYRNIFWYRGGLASWDAAGLPLE